jgi:hypothetical protein
MGARLILPTMRGKVPAVFLAVTASMMAQPFGAGFKIGLPLNDAFDVHTSSNIPATLKNKQYIIGPQFEIRLPAGFSVELDALYTSFEVNTVANAATSLLARSFDASSWEFPLLLKKKFRGVNAEVAAVRPFFDLGASFRRLSDVDNIGDFITGDSSGVDKTATGFVIGGGVEIRALFLRISPEVRFTHWGTDNFREGLSNIFKTNRNQGQFLVGIHF